MKYSYLENRKIEDALKGYIEFLSLYIKKLETKVIKSEDAGGRITACAVIAKISSPHYNACAMDGITVKAVDTYGATETTPVTLSSSQFKMVDTGDPVPEGFDCVIMIEDVVFNGDSAVIRAAACAWQHVRQIGEDLCLGDMILPSYTKVTPAGVGAILAGGVNEIEVLKKVRVGIIPTGDELIPSYKAPENGEILEFNSKIFKAQLTDAGCDVKIYDIVKDKLELIMDSLKLAASENDIIIINAGSSAGRDDYTKTAIEQTGAVFCHGIAIKPGKPAVLGVCGNVPTFGVPGYPVSAAVVVENIVIPVIETILKNKVLERQTVNAILTRKITSDLKYQEYLRVKLGFINDTLIAVPLASGAGVISSLARADGIAVIPCDSEGIAAGESVSVSLLKSLDEINNTLIITGSHDPLIDVVGDIMRRETGIFISSTHVGSIGGIMALMKGEAHIAPIHLLDTLTGKYNTSYIDKYFEKESILLIKGVKRLQGIMVKKGNPKSINSIKDIYNKKITYVNRQKGAGTRILLDYLLSKENISPEDIYGYSNEEYTHTAVAAQVASGNADAGLGILSAANLFGLDFIPVANEEYDFIIRKESMDSPEIKAFMDILKSREFIDRLTQMGGYGITNDR